MEAFDRTTGTGLHPDALAKRALTNEEGSVHESDWTDESATESDESSMGTPLAEEMHELLRQIGPNEFLQHYLLDEGMSVRELLSAFHVKVDGPVSDAKLFPLLKIVISRELTRRRKLPHINTIEDTVGLIRDAKHIIVLTGAGISTSLGIPDFRSDKGIYSMVTEYGLSDPQEMFDIELFRHDPSIFYSFAKNILPTSLRFSPTHAFIRKLEEQGKLLTNYTQNIDGLEQLAGISPDKLIQCHGSFATASCTKCKHKIEAKDVFGDIRSGGVPICQVCPRKRKRKGDEDDDDDGPGVIKPDIVFFGEALPKAFEDRVLVDAGKCDLLICIGTSLKVAPVSELIGFLPPTVPQIYINKTPVKHVQFDVNFLGSCDEIVCEFCRRLGWELEHDMLPLGKATGGSLSLTLEPPSTYT